MGVLRATYPKGQHNGDGDEACAEDHAIELVLGLLEVVGSTHLLQLHDISPGHESNCAREYKGAEGGDERGRESKDESNAENERER